MGEMFKKTGEVKNMNYYQLKRCISMKGITHACVMQHASQVLSDMSVPNRK